MGIGLAIAALAVSAVSAYQQYEASKDAADARREASEISGAQGQVRQRQQRRQQIREERIRRARILQAAENTGVAGSAGATGAVGALGTNTGANLGALRAGGLASQGISQANQAAASAQQRGQVWGAVGGLSSGVFQAAGGFGQFQSLGGQSTPIQGGFGSEVFTIDQGNNIFG